MQKLKVDVIGGFLGSGKTTLLLHFLRQPKLDEKVAVLVNEIGEVGIDGRILKRPGFTTVELANGCVCCQITGDMIQAVKDIRTQYKPDRLLIETTGVAEPGKVLTALYSPYLADEVRVEPTLVVVDVSGFERLYKELAYHYVMQVKSADVVVLNKTDLLTPAALKRVEAEVRKINPRALVVATERGRVDLLGLLEGQPGGVPDEDAGHTAETFQSFVGQSDSTYDVAKLERFLKALPASCYRAKGFVKAPAGWKLLNHVTGQTEWEDWPAAEAPARSQLVFIGRRLDEKKLLRALKACETGAGGVRKGAKPSARRKV